MPSTKWIADSYKRRRRVNHTHQPSCVMRHNDQPNLILLVAQLGFLIGFFMMIFSSSNTLEHQHYVTVMDKLETFQLVHRQEDIVPFMSNCTNFLISYECKFPDNCDTHPYCQKVLNCTTKPSAYCAGFPYCECTVQTPYKPIELPPKQSPQFLFPLGITFMIVSGFVLLSIAIVATCFPLSNR